MDGARPGNRIGGGLREFGVARKRKKISRVALEEFLSGLPQRTSRGERADAAHFIRKHGRALGEYVAGKRRTGRDALAAHYERVIERYKEGPGGVSFSESLYSIRSFRPSANISHSLTFPTEHRAARVVGWLLAALIAGLVLFTGYKVARYGAHIFSGLSDARDAAPERQ